MTAQSSGCQNSTQDCLEITAAQVTAEFVSLPNIGAGVIPFKVGGFTYSSQPVPGNMTIGTYYPQYNNMGCDPGPFSGGNEEWWPDPGVLNQYNVIWNMTNLAYRMIFMVAGFMALAVLGGSLMA